MKTFRTLLKVEIILAIREFSGVLFGILFPAGMLLLLGCIYGNKHVNSGSHYTMLQVSFGAVTAIGICATGLMGLPLSLSDYRQKKILKRFKVTPISPMQLLVVQVIVSFLFSMVSAMIVFALAKQVFSYHMEGSAGAFILAFLLTVFAVYSIGMLITSIAPSAKSANFLCSMIYFPMLFLSGATVPYEIMPKGLKIAANILPLTHAIKLLKGVSLGQDIGAFTREIIGLACIGIICSIISIKMFRWE